MSTFTVLILLKENDAESYALLSIASALSSKDERFGFGGGGGYLEWPLTLDKRPIISLCFQKNGTQTGNLVDVTEEDRAWTEAKLKVHPNVESFLVGPIVPDGGSVGDMAVEEAEIVMRFKTMLDSAGEARP